MRVALNAHFRHHPGTGSGQYLTHLLRHLSGVEALPLFRRAPSSLAKLLWEQTRFPLAAHRSGADVWHVPYFAPPLVHTRPLVVTIHDLIPLIIPEYATSPLVRAYNRLVSAGARRADLILADSEASKRDIVRLLGIPAARVRVVYLAADEAVMRPVPADEIAAVRRKYGLADRYVLYFGGLDKRKNVPALLRALAELRDVDWQLAVSGRLRTDNPVLFPDLPAAAAQLGIQDRVRFLGFAPDEDKPALIHGATCFAFPSHYEGFGMDPLEALACGAPVVCSDRSSLPELMGDAALLVDPDAPGALAAALRRVLADDALRADLAARGPAQAARFTWQRTARETEEAYAACAS
ncbi:MAG TPA: glycosyltransferase family 1 protein [Chloroflexota bacterium]|nr:glycosyltransferase family 1 protein [Chloroflexota bacterium]